MADQSVAITPCEAIILAALPEEYQAVVAHLQQGQEIGVGIPEFCGGKKLGYYLISSS